jgi:DNA methylase
VEPLPPTLQTILGSRERVQGLTHELYRYPARFLPTFVGQAIEELSPEDGLVLDPFMGGGTTAVEALARGRRFIGIDLNSLSVVLTRAKTTPLPRDDQAALRQWAAGMGDMADDSDIDDVRLQNAPPEVVQALRPYVASAASLSSPRLRDAARAVLLHVGQWAVDGRAQPASANDTVSRISPATEDLLAGLEGLVREARTRGYRASELRGRRALFEGSARTVAAGRGTNRMAGRVSLVVTSPPYPGVHVLYHRWQVRGRAETALPYWLADSTDGLGPRHYTMGGRSVVGEDVYFRELESIWAVARRLLRPGATVVQVVAFSSPARQLDRYLAAMRGAGYDAVDEVTTQSWRDVPNRRWYFRVRPERGPAKEVLLLHRNRD